ncbi:MAG: CRTAC1 family protein [Rhodothermales bacterium]|nr:CRTAC1 family protein [Rhodothermales bacterium]
MKDRPIARLAVTVVFAGLIAAPVIIPRLSEREEVGLDAETALDRYGFFLQEVAADAGIDFTHQAAEYDARLAHIMPQIAFGGASVSVVDVDGDGWNDLYLTNSAAGSRNALYRNRGDGTFEDVAPALGLADLNARETGTSAGAVWGDYDNDGDEDLFLYRLGRPDLYRNDGGRFTRVTDEAGGFPAWTNAGTAVWFDYDRDGWLDLFIGGYFPDGVDLWALEHTRIMPESFEYARNGGRNFLLHNRGDGTFEEVGEALGVASRRWAMAAAAADLRGTGYPDLVVANDYGVEEVYFNDEGRGFREAGEQTRIGFAPKSGMNVSFGDVFNQGRPAVYVSNISEEGVLIQGNNLWVPRPGAEGDAIQFDNMAHALGIELGGWSWAAQFGDLNNDGFLDLYVTNGYVSGDPDRNYWYDFSKVAGGNKQIISDAANWPDMEGRSLSGYQAKRLWLNDGAGRFREVAQAVGVADRLDGRGAALADLWNRGVLDVVVANQRGPALVYKNTAAEANDWVAFELEGTRSNRSAIGAQVRVFWNGQEQVQEVHGGSGYAAQNQRRLHFGLGPDAALERVVIRWPSGTVQTLDAPELRTIHRIQEPD